MRVASTPEEVERTFDRRAIRSSVLELKRDCAEKGIWVALSDAMIRVEQEGLWIGYGLSGDEKKRGRRDVCNVSKMRVR